MTDAIPTRRAPLRIAVLISGSGSNLQALIDRVADGFIPARIVLVISNRADAFGLERAQKAGIPTRVILHTPFPDRASFEQAMIDALLAAEVELVCLAGFMRVLTPLFIRTFAGRLLNIHPALLPAFPGLHVQQRAIDAGARFSGATVHFVTEEVDAGPIIAQAVVPILDGDDAPSLAARILKREHLIYPLAVKLYAEGRLRVAGQRVCVVDGESIDPEEYLISPAE
ncbi:MAG: phosphoribosylglycinamide formyltransferase [Magnetococcales bacterium]|nr:phosphoribosylglycinamide formyltransferase [Magnetococcales bacterium]